MANSHKEEGLSVEAGAPILSSAGLGEPHLTLTMEEIRDLAQFCGMVVQDPTPAEMEVERETEITIAKWPKKGVWDEDQKCQVPPHKHIAYFDEYPEEGTLPLGSPKPKLSDGSENNQ